LIVIDASALLGILLEGRSSEALRQRVAGETGELHAPHLIDLEVAQVLRRFLAGGEIDELRAGIAFADLADLRLERHSHEPLLPRVWSLRKNLTAYDAAYVALAESLNATLVTSDAALARAPGVAAKVEVY
jgi:predicted nucleic acid-binding protein